MSEVNLVENSDGQLETSISSLSNDQSIVLNTKEKYVDKDIKINISGTEGIYFIVGNSSDAVGLWTGTDNRISEYYNGLTIIYIPGVEGSSDGTTLNINGFGAKNCYYAGTSNLTTQYPIGTPILLTYYNDEWRSDDAASAIKLETIRTIELGKGVTSTATNFDGTENITIPVDSVKEAYLEWGGRNHSASYGPIDAAMVPSLGANRFAFMPAEGIEIQYSRDGGSTWLDYETTDVNKINLFNGNGAGHYIGGSGASGIDKSNHQLRIIITTDVAQVYTKLNKFIIYCSTNGSSESWCTIDGKLKVNVDNGRDDWETFADAQPISGWSGYNVINTPNIITYGNTASTQYQKLRFTFGVKSHPSNSSYGGLTILKIMGFGGVGWITPSTMASTGRMYIYDADKNVTFPANVTASSFLGTATQAIQDELGNNIVDTYSPKSLVVDTVLSASDWTGSTAPFQLTLAIDGVTDTNINEISFSKDCTEDQIKFYQRCGLQDGGQSEGQITLLATKKKPSIDIPVTIIVRKDC